MVQFGLQLESNAIQEWRQHYISYRDLKKRIQGIVKKQRVKGYAAEVGSLAASRARHLFMAQLDAEITKVTVFYLGVQDEVDVKIASMRAQLSELEAAIAVASAAEEEEEEEGLESGGSAAASAAAAAVDAMTAQIAASCRDISREIVRALNFVELNLTGLRKILKKHDKNTTMSVNEIVSAGGSDGLTVRGGLTGLFLESYQAESSVLGQYAGLRALHSLEWSSGAIDEVQDLHAQLVRLAVTNSGMSPFSSAALADGGDVEAGDLATQWFAKNAAADDSDLAGQLTEVYSAIARMEGAQARARESGVFLGRRTWLAQLVAVDYWSRQAGITNLHMPKRDERGIDALHGKLRRLNSHTALRDLAAHSATESDADGLSPLQQQQSATRDIEDEIELLKQQLRFHLIVEKLEMKGTRVTTPLSLWINLFSTLLYMVNYNVVLPTSNEYASYVGVSPAYSGIIVGMTPIAAMISAVLCSWWTNYSFKRPLLCSAMLLTIGNLLYALAYDMPVAGGGESDWNWRLFMLLGGRFICGLGGARALNRRYIADLVSIRDRTRASGAFVAAGAVGMALGPGSAAVFAHLNTTFRPPAGLRSLVPQITLNALTAPGWIMMLIWIIFFIITLCFFLEPAEAIREAQRLERELMTREKSRYSAKAKANAQRQRRARGKRRDEANAAAAVASAVSAEVGAGEAEAEAAEKTGAAGAAVLPHEDADERGRLLSPTRTAYASYTDVESDASMTRGGASSEERPSLCCCFDAFCKRTDSGAPPACNCTCLRVPCPTSVWVCMLLIFWLKGVQEAFLTSIPLVSRAYFNWSSSNAGLLMAFLGISILPANVVMGWFQAPSLQCAAFMNHFGTCIVSLLRCVLSCVGIESKCVVQWMAQVHDFAPFFGEGEGEEDAEEESEDEEDTSSRASSEMSPAPGRGNLAMVREEEEVDGVIGGASGGVRIGGLHFRGISDRWGLLFTEVLGIFGLALFLTYPTADVSFQHPSFGWGGLPRYTIGATIFYIARNLMEGLDMSLMSKVLPSRLARGTCNSGLITTEVGTLGRALGNMVITVVGVNEASYGARHVAAVAAKAAADAAAVAAALMRNETRALNGTHAHAHHIVDHAAMHVHHESTAPAMAALQNLIFVPALVIDVSLFIFTIVLFSKLKTHDGASLQGKGRS